MNDDLIRRGPLESVAEKVLLGLAEPIDLIRAITRAHAVDAVEVVRCKDCKWRNTAGCPYMNFDAAEREDSDFCSDGERRTNNGEIQKETR